MMSQNHIRFVEFNGKKKFPTITEDVIDKCTNEIPIEVNRDFVRSFILNGQTHVREIIDTDETMSEDEDMSTGLWL